MNNNESTQPGTNTKSPGERKAARWLFALACFVTLVALFYAVEDWRGKRKWENYKRQLIADGEHFDVNYYIPKPVPDQDNFIKTPALQRVGYRNRNPGTNSPFPSEPFLSACPASGDSLGDFAHGHRCNLKDEQDFLRGTTPPFVPYERRQANAAPRTNALPPLPRSPEQDIVSATSQFPEYAEILQASRRPLSQFDVKIEWPDSLIPNFVAIRSLSQAFTLRSLAQLKLGDSEAAKENAEVVKRLGDGLEKNPFLVSAMIRVAIMSPFVGSFWEGWTDHKWTPEQLAEFQKDFESVDLLEGVDSSLHAEYVVLASSIEQMNATEIAAMFRSENTFSRWVKVVPRGWVYQNIYNYNRIFRLMFAPNTANRIISPSQAGSAMCLVDENLRHSSPYNILACIAIPNFSKAFLTTARNQTYINEAALVCALERYHAIEGKYPEKLDDLSPRFITKVPQDIVNGESLKYKRIPNDRFTLYSIGWNEKDDGGTPPSTKKGEELGDWVWMYPVD